MVRVLLVEDNPGDVRLILELLAESNSEGRFDVEPVSTLEDGIAAVRKNEFDAILLDLGLPDSQGLDTLERIRSAAPSVPIVITSGLEDYEVGIRSLEVGAEDYICKSKLNAGLLTHALTYALQRRILTDSIKLRTEEAEDQKKRAMVYFDLLAHDVANLIAPIMLICDLTRLDKSASAEVHARARMVSRQAMRASSIITNLRLLEELERANPNEIEPIDLIETITNVKKTIQADGLGPIVEFKLQCSESNRVIVKGGRWIKHVISNLLHDYVKQSDVDEMSILITISLVKDSSNKPFWQMEIISGESSIPDVIEHPSFSSLDLRGRFNRGVATNLSFYDRFVNYFGGEFSVRSKAKEGPDKNTVTTLRLPRGD